MISLAVPVGEVDVAVRTEGEGRGAILHACWDDVLAGVPGEQEFPVHGIADTGCVRHIGTMHVARLISLGMTWVYRPTSVSSHQTLHLSDSSSASRPTLFRFSGVLLE